MEDLYHLGIKALIRNADGKILLLRMSPHHSHGNGGEAWDLPGGRVQEGASPEETLRREVEEETGLTEISIGKHVGMVLAKVRIPLSKSQNVGLILSIYECELPANAMVTISEEHTAFEWFAPAKAAKLLGIKYSDEFCEMVQSL